MNKRTARRSKRPRHRWDCALDDIDYCAVRDKRGYDKARAREAKAWVKYVYRQLDKNEELSDERKKILQNKHKYLKYVR